ncbi:MAG: GntR family transcriptional regulator [Mycetocola sp.]
MTNERQEQRLRYLRARQDVAPTMHSSTRRSYEQLRSSIRSGRLQGESLSEPALKTLFGVTRNSVRRSLQMLAVDGLLSRRPRAGTGLRAQIINLPSAASASSPGEVSDAATDELGIEPGAPEIDVRELRRQVVPMPSSIAFWLQMEGPTILAQEHLGFYRGEAIFLRILYIPLTPDAALVPQSGIHAGVTRMMSLEDSFEDEFGESLGSSGASFEAVPSDASTAQLLGVAEGAPLLLREMILRDSAGLPRSYCFTYFRGDRVAVTSSSPWPGV